MNYIYKTCLLHYLLLLLVLFTQFIFHTFRNLNTLVKTFMFNHCWVIYSVYGECKFLSALYPIDPRSYFIVQGELETPHGFLNEITFGKIVLTLIDAFSVSPRIHVNYYCLNVTLCR